MLEGTVQEKPAWGGRSVRLRHAYERPPSRPLPLAESSGLLTLTL
jgi:hypothetical protein